LTAFAEVSHDPASLFPVRPSACHRRYDHKLLISVSCAVTTAPLGTYRSRTMGRDGIGLHRRPVAQRLSESVPRQLHTLSPYRRPNVLYDERQPRHWLPCRGQNPFFRTASSVINPLGRAGQWRRSGMHGQHERPIGHRPGPSWPLHRHPMCRRNIPPAFISRCPADAAHFRVRLDMSSDVVPVAMSPWAKWFTLVIFLFLFSAICLCHADLVSLHAVSLRDRNFGPQRRTFQKPPFRLILLCHRSPFLFFILSNAL